MSSSAFDPVAAAIHDRRPEYTAQEIEEIFAAGHDVDFTDLEVTNDSRLVEARGGDCSAYTTVTFGSEPEVGSDAKGEYAHFHLQAGVPRPGPWSPGVATPITPERFTEDQLANASAHAQGLPPK